MKLISTTLAGPGTETIIGDALRSVASLVDDTIVIGTAPPGQEEPLFQKICESLPWPMCGQFLWDEWSWRDDFAAARNAALVFAQIERKIENDPEPRADWMIMLDTDERVVCSDPAAVRAFLEALPPEVEVVVAQSAAGDHGRERFFRLPARHRWIGRTHESFPVEAGQQASIPRELITWTELLKTPEQIRFRAERDERLLAEEIAERPNDPRWHLYRGCALQGLGRDEEAIEEYLAAGILGCGEDSVNACFAAALVLLRLRRFDEVLVAAARGMALDARFAELPWIAGVAAMHLGRHDQAQAWARLAEVHGATGKGREILAQRVGHRCAWALDAGPVALGNAARVLAEAKPTRTIVFSKDRPLQLDACLRSLRLHCQDIESMSVHVLCLASTQAFGDAYNELIAATPWAVFHPQQDFEADLRVLLTGSEHVLFVVDDTIFVRDFVVREVVALLEDDAGAIGVSLRLGENARYCYPTARCQRVPTCDLVAPKGILNHTWWRSWSWRGADGDFGYPFDISSSVYATSDIMYAVGSGTFRNPNDLESMLDERKVAITIEGWQRPRLLCAPLSLAFSMPLNRVQSTHANRACGNPEMSAEALLAVWQRGDRIDVGRYSGYTPRGCHEEAPLFLTERVSLAQEAGTAPEATVEALGRGLAHVASVGKPIHITVTSTGLRANEAARKCVRSVRAQSFDRWRLHFFAGDESTREGASLGDEDGHPSIYIHPHEGAGQFPSALENLLPIWRSLPDDEVIVWLDGDDWLATYETLAIVAEEHRKGALATYGSFMMADGSPVITGPCGPDPRAEPWKLSHLKTFRAGLVKRIRDEDLRRPDGAYCDLAIDRVVMLPIVEMAGPRAVWIPKILYVYNHGHSFERNASPDALAREAAEVRRIHAMPRYRRLT